MESFFQHLGISAAWFDYLILPLLIFCARVLDVSFATMRILFVLQGKKNVAPFLGFFEALIWLLAIGQIFQNITNWTSYIAYAAGFGMGTYVGMLVEERLAIGRVVVRVITRKPAQELLDYFRDHAIRFSNIDAEGNQGKVNIIFTVVKRDMLPSILHQIKTYNPKAFYTIETVKKVSDEELALTEEGGGWRLFNFKRR